MCSVGDLNPRRMGDRIHWSLTTLPLALGPGSCSGAQYPKLFLT